MQNIIINSIGTASPRVSKVLSESFKLPQDYFLKLMYNTPSLLFSNLEEELAETALNTLGDLGLDVQVLDNLEHINFNEKSGDISVYVEDISQLPVTIKGLAEFLGTSHDLAFSLLLKEPSFVLGNVSKNTAEALQKRIPAKVHFSKPNEDHYLLVLNDGLAKTVLAAIKKMIGEDIVILERDGKVIIPNIYYEISQKIWKKYKNEIKLINQSHHLCNVILRNFDKSSSKQLDFLIGDIGMPEEIIPKVHSHLPIVLFEQISLSEAFEMNKKCSELGFNVQVDYQVKSESHLEVTEIKDLGNVRNVLKNFIPEKNLPNSQYWKSTKALPKLAIRYIKYLLSHSDCTVQEI